VEVPLAQVPLTVRRVAAQHLESLRDTELMVGLRGARLAPTAVPVHRPDVPGVAYYEFHVTAAEARVLVTRGFAFETDVRRARRKSGEPSPGNAVGFILASTGPHDFPVAHWSLDRPPPSQQVQVDPRLECEPREVRKAAFARLYRLDALSYAAENEAGELVGQVGQIPSLLSGLPHSLERYAGAIRTARGEPPKSQADDREAADALHEMEVSGPDLPVPKRLDVNEWKAFKERYADVFGPFLDQLRRRAARTWELEEAIRKWGEGIRAGTEHRVALLDEAAVEVVGQGAAHVQVHLEEDPPRLSLRAGPGPFAKEAEFHVVVRYRNGEKERLPFFLVSPDTPSEVREERRNRGDSDCEE